MSLERERIMDKLSFIKTDSSKHSQNFVLVYPGQMNIFFITSFTTYAYELYAEVHNSRLSMNVYQNY